MNTWARKNPHLVVKWEKDRMTALVGWERDCELCTLTVEVEREPGDWDRSLLKAGQLLASAWESLKPVFGASRLVSPFCWSFTQSNSGLWLGRLEVGPSPWCKRSRRGFDLGDLASHLKAYGLAVEARKAQMRLPGL